jgi:hypothetical protein
MTPTTMRTVLVEGESADRINVDEQHVERTGADGPATRGGTTSVIAATLGTRQRAAEIGYELLSTGVSITDPAAIAALRDRRSMRSRAVIALAWKPERLS